MNDGLFLNFKHTNKLTTQQREKWLSTHDKYLNDLAAHYPLIEPYLENIAIEFINQVASQNLISQSETKKSLQIKALKHAAHFYMMELLSNDSFDDKRLNNTLRFALLHEQFPNSHAHLAALWILKNLIQKEFKKIIFKDTSELIHTLDKLFFFEVSLLIEAYIHNAEAELKSCLQDREIFNKTQQLLMSERTTELIKLANLDPVTNLYNQRAMRELATQEIKTAKRQNETMTAIYFDIDDFKDINDQNGHLKGDEVLKRIGLILQSQIRETDIPCRYGGDEFCLILRNCNRTNARHLCEKLIPNFRSHYPNIFLSFGIACADAKDLIDLNTLIDNADKKMYQAKKEKGFSIYPKPTRSEINGVRLD